jgi:hypothetical protein
LNPGDVLFLSDGTESVEITVLKDKRKIELKLPNGKKISVSTRVTEELHTEDGTAVERSRNFFARCKETNDIFYLARQLSLLRLAVHGWLEKMEPFRGSSCRERSCWGPATSRK